MRPESWAFVYSDLASMWNMCQGRGWKAEGARNLLHASWHGQGHSCLSGEDSQASLTYHSCVKVNNDFLGVAFSGLRGEELFPIVSAVWGHCEVRQPNKYPTFLLLDTLHDRSHWPTWTAITLTENCHPPETFEDLKHENLLWSEMDSYSELIVPILRLWTVTGVILAKWLGFEPVAKYLCSFGWLV